MASTLTPSINQIYQQQLGRDADADGAAYWGGLLQSGVSVDDIISGINASDEGKQYDLATVNKAYQDHFGRPAESVGADYWFNKAQTSALSSSLLSEAIRNAAQADDVKARDDNAVYSSAWTPGWDVNSSGYRYNPASDKWEVNTSSDQPQNVPAVATTSDQPQNVPAVATNVPSGQPRNITPNETVSHQLNTLLSENSPYMQSATNRAMEQANSRGLLNSSIAVGADQRAAIDAALPIAQQDAKTYADSGMAAQNYGYDSALSEQSFRQQGRLNDQNFGFQTALNDQNIQGNIGIANNAAQRDIEKTNLLAEIDRLKVERAAEIDKAINDAKYTWESSLQKQRDDANMTLQTTLKQMDIDYDLGKLAQADRDSYGQAAYPIIQQTQAEIAKINTTPDSQLNADAKVAAITGLQVQMKTQLQNLGKIYGYELSWEQPEMGLLSEKSNSATTQKYVDNLQGQERYLVADANPNIHDITINQALSGTPRATILAIAKSGGGTINGVYIPQEIALAELPGN